VAASPKTPTTASKYYLKFKQNMLLLRANARLIFLGLCILGCIACNLPQPIKFNPNTKCLILPDSTDNIYVTNIYIIKYGYGDTLLCLPIEARRLLMHQICLEKQDCLKNTDSCLLRVTAKYEYDGFIKEQSYSFKCLNNTDSLTFLISTDFGLEYMGDISIKSKKKQYINAALY
jgi:hypothetical protein